MTDRSKPVLTGVIIVPFIPRDHQEIREPGMIDTCLYRRWPTNVTFRVETKITLVYAAGVSDFIP